MKKATESRITASFDAILYLTHGFRLKRLRLNEDIVVVGLGSLLLFFVQYTAYFIYLVILYKDKKLSNRSILTFFVDFYGDIN